MVVTAGQNINFLVGGYSLQQHHSYLVQWFKDVLAILNEVQPKDMVTATRGP